jgi:hypothetical protein
MVNGGDNRPPLGGLPSLAVAAVALALGSGILGFLLGSRSAGSSGSGPQAGGLVIQAGVADPKVEKAYVRNGISERIMSEKRRQAFGDCYRGYLARRAESSAEDKPEEGKIAVVFEIAENGRMVSFEVIDNELGDDSLQECLTAQLEGLRFLPPPLGISRHQVYDFWFKKDETVRREMEERNSRPALELIPTNPTPSPSP